MRVAPLNIGFVRELQDRRALCWTRWPVNLSACYRQDGGFRQRRRVAVISSKKFSIAIVMGFFAVAKTEMTIPRARRRAWSLRDCRRAVTFQATLAKRHPVRRFACCNTKCGGVVGVWV